MRAPRRILRACPVLALLVALCISRELPAADSFEFLYINANEGSASGGHTAIKFGDAVFHFQHVPPGLLRIGKEDFEQFRYQYGYRENRTLRAHRVEVSEKTYDELRNAFNRRWLIQDEQFGQWQGIGRDLRLMEALQQRSHPTAPPVTLELKALGYFVRETWQALSEMPRPADKSGPSSLARLREAIAAAHGKDFAAEKRRQSWSRLQALSPSLPGVERIDMEEERFAPGRPSFAQDYADWLTNIAALDLLQGWPPPRTEAMWQGEIPELRLKTAEVAKLDEFRRTLLGDLVRLLGSERSDWGFPMLVGMARLHTLDLAIATGRLVLLNRFREEDKGSNGDEPASGFRAALFEQSRDAFMSAKAALMDGAKLDERHYAQLEETANLFLEMREAMLRPRPARLSLEAATPSRPGAAAVVPIALRPERLRTLRDFLLALQAGYADRLRVLYRYNLIERNCVTEIFRVINQTLGTHVAEGGDGERRQARLRAESARLLGGYVDERDLNLIPFVAFRSVGARYRVRSSTEWPSYRDEWIRRDALENPAFLVDLRESNVLSSNIYRWTGEDAAFLFFTQDAVLPRPLMGGANLAVALGQTAAGLFTLPWDSGENLRKSLKGVFVSLPELAFFNIRKGSFPRVPWLPVNGAGVVQ